MLNWIFSLSAESQRDLWGTLNQGILFYFGFGSKFRFFFEKE
jgi:hypothetical protein